MSGPYVYTPQLNYHNSPYLAPITDHHYSPFIPNMSLSGSPYSQSSPLPHSPSRPYTPNSVPFPGGPHTPTFAPDGWVRERRPSWHGGTAPPVSPPGWLQAPYTHQRTRSFGESTYTPQRPVGSEGYWPPPSSSYQHYAPAPFPTNPFYIHPWINGEAPRSDFMFDLSASDFAPLRYVGNGQSAILNMDELSQSAIHPPITYMRVECDLIPQWPIDVTYHAQHASAPSPNPPPLTLGAVLSVVYYVLQQPITQEMWASLDQRSIYEVSKAYTRRCRAMPSKEMLLRNQGVKKVDFLGEKVYFRGLVRVGPGFDHMKLIVG